MSFFEFFNNLSPYLKNDIASGIFHFLCVILVNIISYLYILVKFYRVICYSKLTFEWLPIINPYIWPYSIFLELTNPYFKLWSKLFPMIRFQDSSIDVSAIIALETLNSLIYFCVRMGNSLIVILEDLEKITAKD
jgi:uncharacterized protein YggT (Ycf19 family)